MTSGPVCHLIGAIAAVDECVYQPPPFCVRIVGYPSDVVGRPEMGPNSRRFLGPTE